MVDTVWINGIESDGRLPVTDSSVLRGDGCFEVLRAYDGRAFALEEHLDRLERSAAMLEIDLPAREDIAAWVEAAAVGEPWGAVRIVVTRGSSLPSADAETQVVVFAHRWDRVTDGTRLGLVSAPWHSAGAEWDLSGAKLLSYAANMSASRAARRSGFDDAVLVTVDGVILEGPTFSLAWVCEGALETPSLGLGILDSITRKHVLELADAAGIDVVEGVWAADRLDAAVEVMALSTIKEVQPVVAVGERTYQPGPVTGELAMAFAQLVGSSPSRQEV